MFSYISVTDLSEYGEYLGVAEFRRRAPTRPGLRRPPIVRCWSAWLSPTAVVEHIAEISTRFWLALACDRHLLQVAAAKVVAQHQPEIVAFLHGPAAR